MDGHACMRGHMDIGRASLYEYIGRQPGIRLQAAIAGALSAEQSLLCRGGAPLDYAILTPGLFPAQNRLRNSKNRKQEWGRNRLLKANRGMYTISGNG